MKERTITLDRAIDICCSSETAARQSFEIKPEQAVHKVTYKGHSKKQKFHAKPQTKEYDEKECKFCDTTRVMKKSACPAWGQICKYCDEPNHFACKCPVK